MKQAREMERALPDAKLQVVEGGGHLILPLRDLPWRDWLLDLAGKIRGSPP